MRAIQKAIHQWGERTKRAIDPFSLQFRLTAGVTLVSLLGVGSVATWTAWKSQRILMESHKEWIAEVATRIPQDVNLYQDMLPLPEAITKAVDVRSLPGLMITVQDEAGSPIATANAFQDGDVLEAIAPNPPGCSGAELLRLNGQYYVVCGDPLVLNNQPVGHLFILQDVTSDQQMFLSLLRSIGLATLLVCVVMPGAIALYVRRSLRPLREMGQLNENLAVQDLGNTHLSLEKAPTEIAELAQSYEGMLNRLSEAWEQQRRFVGDVSHELRTPLTIVSGYLNSMLRRSQSLTEPQREALTIAAAEADHTIQILQDMLELARADSGYTRFELETVSLNDVAHEVASMAERCNRRPVLIEAHLSNILVRADRDRLKQVLLNLVENALKYSPADAPVWIQLEQVNEQGKIQVCDRGCGIPLQQQARIFDRFYRVDETRTRSTGGCGLGLALVKTLIEGMNGSISVFSTPGEGSTFTITLPMATVKP